MKLLDVWNKKETIIMEIKDDYLCDASHTFYWSLLQKANLSLKMMSSNLIIGVHVIVLEFFFNISML